MKAFVTGGSGFVGRGLISRLIAEGYSVSVLTRRKDVEFPQNINVVIGDLATGIGIDTTSFAFCDVIFHCAGETENIALMRKIHIDGTRTLLNHVIKAAKANGRSIHWVQLSSVGAFGHSENRASKDRVVTESTAEAPIGEYERTKAESDRLVVEAAKSGDLTYSILRPSNVFGSEMPNQSLRALIKTVQRGLFFYIGRSGAIANYVHIDDVVDALIKCATDVRARGQVYNISNDCSLEELICGIADALRVKSPWIRLPERFVRVLVSVLSRGISLRLTQDRINALVRRTAYPMTKLKRELNFEPSRYVPDTIGELIK